MTHLSKRLLQLYAGLTVYGISMALMIEAKLGSMPWDVFHQGVAKQTGLALGWVVMGVGALVLLLWIPLRQKPGIGTISNVLVIGFVAQSTLELLPTPDLLPVRVAFLVTGVVLNGLAGGLYIGARLGPGPRDGLMTSIAARTGKSIRLVRTLIEIAVVTSGFLLGGTLGLGTALYALTIGPLVQFFLPRLTVVPTR
ncbi:YczE/YyaS/YitT family protein [Longispora albida]|uniref:membrane protein YczE n=1 Tax=Longispora albida TaxID=203523 RepID=UPI00037FB75B|nr:hypothetical protein [Longispora albida]